MIKKLNLIPDSIVIKNILYPIKSKSIILLVLVEKYPTFFSPYKIVN